MRNKSTDKKTCDIARLLAGTFLVDQKWFKNWPFILYLSLLALIMIASGHSVNRKIQRIAWLRPQVEEMRFEYINTRSRLMIEGMKSKVVEKASELGLEQAKNPPIAIKTAKD